MESVIEKVDPEEIVRRLERLIILFDKKSKQNHDEKECKALP